MYKQKERPLHDNLLDALKRRG